MATLLDDRLVADAMTNLDDWTGDASRISRTVRVNDTESLLSAVSEVADALDHHPVVEQDGGAVTFVLWTHSQGGVTELDIALASRIDDLVLAAQGRERPRGDETPNIDAGGQTTPSRPEESATGDAGVPGAAADAPTINEPANPRQGAGPVVAPDAEPGSMEPQPGNAAAPGMHEGTDSGS
jgi:4a-hydroxytetrahydrobiopterin dehydratase